MRSYQELGHGMRMIQEPEGFSILKTSVREAWVGFSNLNGHKSLKTIRALRGPSGNSKVLLICCLFVCLFMFSLNLLFDKFLHV